MSKVERVVIEGPRQLILEVVPQEEIDPRLILVQKWLIWVIQRWSWFKLPTANSKLQRTKNFLSSKQSFTSRTETPLLQFLQLKRRREFFLKIAQIWWFPDQLQQFEALPPDPKPPLQLQFGKRGTPLGRSDDNFHRFLWLCSQFLELTEAYYEDENGQELPKFKLLRVVDLGKPNESTETQTEISDENSVDSNANDLYQKWLASLRKFLNSDNVTVDTVIEFYFICIRTHRWLLDPRDIVVYGKRDLRLCHIDLIRDIKTFFRVLGLEHLWQQRLDQSRGILGLAIHPTRRTPGLLSRFVENWENVLSASTIDPLRPQLTCKQFYYDIEFTNSGIVPAGTRHQKKNIYCLEELWGFSWIAYYKDFQRRFYKNKLTSEEKLEMSFQKLV